MVVADACSVCYLHFGDREDLLSGMMLSGYERDDASDNSDEELAFAVHDHAQADALTGRAVYLDLCQQVCANGVHPSAA